LISPDPSTLPFVAREYGVGVEPRLIAVFRASLRAKEVLEQARARAREVIAAHREGKAAAETPVPQDSARA